MGANVARMVTVRDVTDEDWPAIYPFFAEIVAAGRTYAYPLDLSTEDAFALWMERPPAQTFVAVDGNRIVGSAKAGPNRPGRGAHVATASFMVDPAAQARGIGRALAEHVLAWATAAGYLGMQFNAVVETNESAVHLWQDLGFRIIGTVPEAFDDAEYGLVGVHVMYRELTSARA
jgi:L-amino acid N-acyltransferase YncA